MEQYSSESSSPSSCSPKSPIDITVQGDLESAHTKEALTFSDCQELAKAVKDCSESLIKGSWVEVPDIRGKTPRFIPANFDSAKAFLRASVESLPRTKNRQSRGSVSDTPVTSRRVPNMGVCHGCHGPMGGGAHQGSAPGKNVCTFTHSLYCRGGIVEDVTWAPCPPGYTFNTDLDLANGTGFDSTLHTFQFQPGGLQNGMSSSTPEVGGHNPPLSQAAPPFVQVSQPVEQDLGQHGGNSQVSVSTYVNGAGGPLLPERRQLQKEFPTTERMASRIPLSDNIQEKIDNHRSENQIERNVGNKPVGDLDITGLRGNPLLRAEVEAVLESVVRDRIPSLAAHQSAGPVSTIPSCNYMAHVPTTHPLRSCSVTAPSNPTTAGPLPNFNPKPPMLQAAPTYVQGLAQHPQCSQYVVSQQHPSSGHAQPALHQDPLTGLVPPGMHQSHQLPRLSSQQSIWNNQSIQAQDVDFCYEWVTDSTGRRLLVRSRIPPLQPNQQAVTAYPNQQQPHQYVGAQSPQYKTEFRCSPTTGRQWTVQVPVKQPPTPKTPQTVLEWRINPITGERYQVPVLATGQHQVHVQTSHPLSQDQFNLLPQQVHQQVHQPAGNTSFVYQQQPPTSPDNSNLHHHDQPSNTSLSRQERVAGIVSLIEGGGGTRKASKVIDFSKKCPTKWAKSATLSNINLPLYAWGVIEELEATLSGREESLPSSTVLGKLRHLKNTLEVCCQNSSAQDFTGYGWTLAKDYSTKLNDEIEQGKTSWQEVPSEVKTSTLMSASMENPRPQQKFDPVKKPKATDDKRETCTTYNKCTVENKCEYEVANPSRTCQRKHECSWCKLHKNQSWKHQEWRCRNKGTSGSD